MLITCRELELMSVGEVRQMLDASTPEEPIQLSAADGMVALVFWQNHTALRGFRIYLTEKGEKS